MAVTPDYRNKRDELERIFKSMPTYVDGFITTNDFPRLINEMKFERTQEQIQAYVEYWDRTQGGKVDIETFVSHATSLHKTSEYARQLAISADKDNNGFISSDEFLDITALLIIHDTDFPGISYDDFMAEADTNKDGKVSIDECGAWIEKKMKHCNA